MIGEFQAPGPCPSCGSEARLFTPNATRDPGATPVLYEAAWQCTACGTLEFPATPPAPPDAVVDFLRPVQVDEAGALWLAADCGDWSPIVREHALTVVIDLEEGLDRGIPAHPDRVIYVYFPIADEGLPSLTKLHAVAQMGAALLQQGERVLVHCEMGLNRSALVAGLILVYAGMSGADALATLQTRRPGALYNETFAGHLGSQPAFGSTGNR